MKIKSGMLLIVLSVISLLVAASFQPSEAVATKARKTATAEAGDKWAATPKASFDAGKISDMSDFDPATWQSPTGDTIKIGYINSFSGPAAINGQLHFAPIAFAVHDINKRGGIWVDGKKKLVELIKADHMSKADQCKKVAERLILQEKVHILMGTSGSHLMKIISDTAAKYKIIAVNEGSVADSLMDAQSFNRYTFMPSFTTDQAARALAYYYGQIRKKEKKFYILNQDYALGHEFAESFKQGLKKFFPEAQIVGEDYHKLFLTDYAPYLTKIKASGAEVIFSGDWTPDSGNLLKQARQMGITLPVANLYMDEPNELHDIGVEGTKGLVNIDQQDTFPFFKESGRAKLHKAWNDQWKTWKTPPYNSKLFAHCISSMGTYNQVTYWMLSVIERAKSTNADKIIKVWEGDTYRFANGKVAKMRACDHKTIQDLLVTEFGTPEEQKQAFNVPPYYFFQGCSYHAKGYKIPAGKVLPSMDQKIDQCRGKNLWGE